MYFLPFFLYAQWLTILSTIHDHSYVNNGLGRRKNMKSFLLLFFQFFFSVLPLFFYCVNKVHYKKMMEKIYKKKKRKTIVFEPLEHKIKRRNKNDKNLCICDLLKLVENSKSILFPLLYTLKSLYYALYCVVLVKREAFNSSLSHSICIGIAGSCINVSTEKNLLCFV